MNWARYLSRIGLSFQEISDKDVDTVERLQRAHVSSVPFENLSIIGDPFNDRNGGEGGGISFALPTLYEQIVTNHRGGLCYELNRLFEQLLLELGFDVTRVAARVFSRDDGGLGPLRSHVTLIVSLDEPYLVDVGFGDIIRRPLPFDGTTRSVPSGEWRVIESDRSDTDYEVQFRGRKTEQWTGRYVFQHVHREMDFFDSGREYHQNDPNAPFNEDPIITVATSDGRKTLSRDAITYTDGRTKRRKPVDEIEWKNVLKDEFGISLDT